MSLVKPVWGMIQLNFFLHHPSELSLAYLFLHSKQIPLITLCGPTVFNHTLGFTQVKPYIHNHGKIWKMSQKLLNSTSPSPSEMFPTENAMRTVTENSSLLFPSLQTLNTRGQKGIGTTEHRCSFSY